MKSGRSSKVKEKHDEAVTDAIKAGLKEEKRLADRDKGPNGGRAIRAYPSPAGRA